MVFRLGYENIATRQNSQAHAVCGARFPFFIPRAGSASARLDAARGLCCGTATRFTRMLHHQAEEPSHYSPMSWRRQDIALSPIAVTTHDPCRAWQDSVTAKGKPGYGAAARKVSLFARHDRCRYHTHELSCTR